MSLPVCIFLLYLNVGVRVCQSHLLENKCQELLIQITSGKDAGDGKPATAKEMPGLYKERHITTSYSMKYMQRRRISITSCQQMMYPNHTQQSFGHCFFFLGGGSDGKATHQIHVGEQAHSAGG